MARNFVLLIFFIAAFSWAFFTYIIFNTPPSIEDSLVFSNIFYFFLSGIIATALTAALVFYFSQRLIEAAFLAKERQSDFSKVNLLRKLLIQSLRRGILLAALIFGLGLLRLFGVLTLLNAGLLLGTIVLIEIYFSNR